MGINVSAGISEQRGPQCGSRVGVQQRAPNAAAALGCNSGAPDAAAVLGRSSALGCPICGILANTAPKRGVPGRAPYAGPQCGDPAEA